MTGCSPVYMFCAPYQSTFNDGESNIKILDTVRGQDVYVIQPMGPPMNHNIMELLLMITTIKRAGARHITAIVPYYAYGRSSEKVSQ